MSALRSFLISIVFAISAATSASGDCSAISGLMSLFAEMDQAAANGGIFIPGKLLISQRLAYRFDGASVRHALQGTDIDDYADLISDTVRYAPASGGGYAGNPNHYPVLTNPRVREQISRSRAILARLDCPPPVGSATLAGQQTALPRSASASAEGGAFDLFSDMTAIIVAVVGISLSSALAMVWNHWRKRQKRLARRFICMLPVTIFGRSNPPSIHQTTAIDISRKGIKMHAVEGYSPKMEDKTAIRVGPEDLLVHFKWTNQHYLGGEFAEPLSKAYFDALLALSHHNVEQAERDRACA